MESKYYTPEIEEFYVGFEYEVLLGGDDYEKDVFITSSKFGFDDIDDLVNISRVKYLDKHDVESLDFKMIESEKSNYWGPLFERIVEDKIGFNTGVVYRIHLGQDSQVLISTEVYSSYGSPTSSIQMIIKNKSELKRILKQIGI